MAMSKADDKEFRNRHSTGVAAQVAAHALKILTGNESKNYEGGVEAETSSQDDFNPLDGWSEAVSLNKTHFCLLLKPQCILRSEASEDSVIILAAAQATLQAYSILDTANIDDPISGRVMTRWVYLFQKLQKTFYCINPVLKSATGVLLNYRNSKRSHHLQPIRLVMKAYLWKSLSTYEQKLTTSLD